MAGNSSRSTGHYRGKVNYDTETERLDLLVSNGISAAMYWWHWHTFSTLWHQAHWFSILLNSASDEGGLVPSGVGYYGERCRLPSRLGV